VPLAIGMNSGSSLDSIDAVLVEVELGIDGQPQRPRFVDGITHQWPLEVERPILAAFANELTIYELTRLNYVAGAVYAEAARSLMVRTGVDASAVMVLGVDGQTIYQEPPDHAGMRQLALGAPLLDRWLEGPYPCGMQIGESAIIAAHTGVPTVTHFRPADHALGGTGAPLMQYLDWVAFRDIAPVLTLNIGGIANCHLAQADRSRMIAFDTGPGNVMMDHAARKLFGRTHDPDGEIAASMRRCCASSEAIRSSRASHRAARGAWISAPCTRTRPWPAIRLWPQRI
jgi:anhydro-N-acetylmuramic acid kinase